MVVASFVAGQEPTATDYDNIVNAINGAQETLWVLTDTAGFTAIGASGAEATNTSLTAPSSAYAAHTAYRLTFRALIRAGTTSGTTTVNVRDTSASGTLRMSNVSFATTTSNQMFHWEHVIANTTASAITRVLVVSLSHSAAGGASFNGASALPWYVECQVVGLDSEYPHAVAL